MATNGRRIEVQVLGKQPRVVEKGEGGCANKSGKGQSITPRPAGGENARQSHAGAARQGSRPPNPLLIFLRRSQVTELFQEQQIVSDL